MKRSTNPDLKVHLHSALAVVSFLAVAMAIPAQAQISIPSDAPKPLDPENSRNSVSLPDGFSLQLLASEPLIRNPSGVCWDERGRLFVSELHGYNLEGQYDIEELNKTGKLDREVRRIPAPKEAIEKAERDQIGSVKRLIDRDGDGVLDHAEVWADDLNACFGVVPARGGVIAICAPDIVYLADRDGDGVAEVREILFTGFRTGVLERRMSNPQWGDDDWIYVAGGGGTITGPGLAAKVEMPRNDFRFQADGSAIEPLTVGTSTFGFTFSSSGDRYVISTGTPAIYVAPLPWRYLARNPNVGFGSLATNVGPGGETYPTSQPHPWRSRRAADPGFEELYRTRYGAAESAPNGFFTSACSPFVYKDSALPLIGQLLACEPAQNMIHRSVITRDSLVPQLRRPESEQKSEFLASTDIWFHPIAMSHSPDGAIVISDFYREIIEDYSAIPRYLQQEYQLKHGEQHGRLWKLVHRQMPASPSAGKRHDMSQLSAAELAGELAGPRFWRRQTAKRLLIERQEKSAIDALQAIVASEAEIGSVIAALHTLDALGGLSESDLLTAIQHRDPAVLVQALRLADQRFSDHPRLLESALTLVNHPDPRVLVQLALSFGETADWRAQQSLAILAAQSIEIRWLDDAILSSLGRGFNTVLQSLFLQTGTDPPSSELARFLSRLAKMVVQGQDDAAISQLVTLVLANPGHAQQQLACLDGMQQGFSRGRKVELADKALDALRAAARNDNRELAQMASSLVIAMKAETSAERRSRLQQTALRITDVQQPIDARIAAVEELVSEQDKESTEVLLANLTHSTPTIRKAISDALFSRDESLPLVLAAIEQQRVPTAVLSSIQREVLLTHQDDAIRDRAAKLFAAVGKVDPQAMSRYVRALQAPRDRVNGEAVFKKHCSNCHKSHGIGFDVGPDLVSEFQRSEETFIQDILAPAAAISAGYASYIVQTTDGVVVTGLIASESPTSITLRQAEGKEQTILRKDIEGIRASEASLMPDDLAKSLQPKDVADVISWLRRSGK